MENEQLSNLALDLDAIVEEHDDDLLSVEMQDGLVDRFFFTIFAATILCIAKTMIAMRDMLQKDNDSFDIKPTHSFDVTSLLNMDDEQSTLVDEVLALWEMAEADDREPKPERNFEDEQRDGQSVEDCNRFAREVDLEMELTCEDFGFMPYCPVDTKRGDDFLGLTPTYLPNQKVSRTEVYQQPEIVTRENASNTAQTSLPPLLYPAEEPRNEGFRSTSPFNESNETNLKPEMVQEPHQPHPPVAAVSGVVRDAAVPVTDSHILSPWVGFPAKDYSAEWQQRQESGDLDYFAELIPQPHGLKSVSTADLGHIRRQHCVVKTKLGLVVLLDSEGASKGNIRSLQQPAVLKQPTSNVLGVRQANGGTSSRSRRWSPEEDNILKAAVEAERGDYDWKRIASKYFGNVRSAAQCKSRWTKSLKPGIVRGAWTAEEDACILKYRQEGLGWTDIAGFLPGRASAQIGSRYRNFLDPSLKKTPWTPEEDLILFQEQRRIGNKWTKISLLIPGRSEGSVKNRWHNLKATHQRNKNLKRKVDDVHTTKPPQQFVVVPPGSAGSPRQIVDAPPRNKNSHRQLVVLPPRNAHTIFRSKSCPPTYE